MLQVFKHLGFSLGLAALTSAAMGAGSAKLARIAGTSANVSGRKVESWARVDEKGKVVEVGVTMPFDLVMNPPAEPGKGPCGALAVLEFPQVVKKQTYFDHFETQWNPNGHPPACCYEKPHFDLHFYGMPVSSVWKIMSYDNLPPAGEYAPQGYVWTGKDGFIPQMGNHMVLPADLAAPFTVNMVAGFYSGRMNFIEPMTLRAFLLEKKTFQLATPKPEKLGRSTSYPTKFVGSFDVKSNSYQFVFSDFVSYKS